MSDTTAQNTEGKLDEATWNRMEGVALALNNHFNGEDCPYEDQKYGFFLMIFPRTDERPRGNYVSNCPREDMITTMREFIAMSPVEKK